MQSDRAILMTMLLFFAETKHEHEDMNGYAHVVQVIMRCRA